MIVCIRVPSDALHDTAWQELLDALDAVTPLIEDARMGTAFLDMHGADGDFVAWSRMIRTLLVPLHLRVCIGAGPNRFCAFAAAWSGDGTVIVAGRRSGGARTDAARRSRTRGRYRAAFAIARYHDARRACRFAARAVRAPIRPGCGALAQRRAWDRSRPVRAARTRDHDRSRDARGRLGAERGGGHLRVARAARTDLRRSRALRQTCERAASRDRTRERRHRARRPSTRCCDLARARDARRIARQTRRCEFSCADLRAALARDGLRRGRRSRAAARRRRDRPRERGGGACALGSDARRAGASRTDAVRPIRSKSAFATNRSRCPNAIRPAAPRRNRSSCRSCVLLAVTEIDVRLRRGEPATVGEHTVQHVTGPWRIEEGWFASPVARDEYDVQFDTGEICRIYRQGDHWYLRGSYD